MESVLFLACELMARAEEVERAHRERRRAVLRALRGWMRRRAIRAFTAQELLRLLLAGSGNRSARAFQASYVPRPRRWWVRPQVIRNWWAEEVLPLWDEDMWIRNFRMSKATLFEIAEALRPQLQARDTIMRRAITVEERVAITVWWLSAPLNYRRVARRFQIGVSTAAIICTQVICAIEKELLQKTVCLGNYRQVMEGFQQLGFPHCVGALDGIHIPIQPPRARAKEYFNQKYGHSIVLQGMTSATGLFLNIEAGFSGRNHNAFIFRHSALCQAMDEGAFVPGNPMITIHGVEVPPLVIADGAYPLCRWLMKPYSGALQCNQLKFNMALSRAHCVVERAFGRLKGRWGCLGARLTVGEKYFATVVSACVVLHNICETKGHALHSEEPTGELQLAPMPEEYLAARDLQRQTEGELVRGAIAAMIAEQQ